VLASSRLGGRLGGRLESAGRRFDFLRHGCLRSHSSDTARSQRYATDTNKTADKTANSGAGGAVHCGASPHFRDSLGRERRA
jgi:hypothetical protein